MQISNKEEEKVDYLASLHLVEYRHTIIYFMITDSYVYILQFFNMTNIAVVNTHQEECL